MVAEIAHLRIAEQLVPTTLQDSHPADLTGGSDAVTEHVTGAATLCATYAKSTDVQMNIQLANVISDLSGVTGAADCASHRGRGTRSAGSSPNSVHPRIQRQPRRDCQKPGGQLAPGTGSSKCCNRKWRCMTPTSGGWPNATRNCRSTCVLLPTRSHPQPRKICLRKRRRNKTRIIRTSISPMNSSASPELQRSDAHWTASM